MPQKDKRKGNKRQKQVTENERRERNKGGERKGVFAPKDKGLPVDRGETDVTLRGTPVLG